MKRKKDAEAAARDKDLLGRGWRRGSWGSPVESQEKPRGKPREMPDR